MGWMHLPPSAQTSPSAAAAYARDLDTVAAHGFTTAPLCPGWPPMGMVPIYVLGDDLRPSDLTAMRNEPGFALIGTADASALLNDDPLLQVLASQMTLIVPTPAARVALSRRLPGTRVCCVPPPIAPLGPAERDASRLWRARKSSGDAFIVVVETDDSGFGSDLALCAFTRLRRHRPRTWLLVCRERFPSSSIWSRASMLQHINVLVSGDDRMRWRAIAGADAVLLPSPVPTLARLDVSLRCLAAGTPAIALDGSDGGLPRTVVTVRERSDGACAAAALDFLLEHEDLRVLLAAAGAEYLERQHSVAVVARALIEAFVPGVTRDPRHDLVTTAVVSEHRPPVVDLAGRALAELGITGDENVLLSRAALALTDIASVWSSAVERVS